MKTEDEIARAFAADVFGVEEPDERQIALARQTFGFGFALLEVRKWEAAAEIVEELRRSWAGRVFLRIAGL